MKDQIKLVKERLKSDSPPFWKRIRKYAIIGTIVLSGAAAFATGFGAPAWVAITIGALDAMCVTTITNASLTTSDPDLSKR